MKLFPFSVSETDRPKIEKLIARDLEQTTKVVEFNENIEMPARIDLPLKIPLREYQKKAVEAIALQKRILIADDVGLGKTAIAIAAILRQFAYPSMFVTKPQLNEQLVREFNKFTPTICIDKKRKYLHVDSKEKMKEMPPGDWLVIHKIETMQPYELPPANMYIMKYSCLRGWPRAFARKKFEFVVFDECQELRHSRTAKYRAATKLAQKADFCVGLTATPVYNYGDEIFHVLNIIKPRCLGKYIEFVSEWARKERNGKIIIENPKALGAYMREQLYMIRRTRHDVGLELPEVNHVLEYVDHDVQLFNQEIGEILELAKKTLFGFTNEERMTSSGMLDVKLRHSTGVAKAHYVAARTRIILESGQPVVLVGCTATSIPSGASCSKTTNR